MKKYSADLIITNDGDPIKDGVIIIDESTGKIIDVLNSSEHLDDVNVLKGVLLPGYVNAHCHLELSHLKGVISTGTGLITFIKGVVGLREYPEEVIQARIEEGDNEMWNNGIVAVGDISNKADTASVKSSSPIRYYTFVEMFDFLQEDQAEKTFQSYKKVFEEQAGSGNNRKSYVPHAPYSVSLSLFQKINELNPEGSTISIHNQELAAENEFFISKTGGFIDFYESFGIGIEDFKPTGKNSIEYTIRNLDPIFNTLMVHNTKSTKDDISRALMWNANTYWVTCPNANLYIENALPDYSSFIDCGATMCIGTDSLSSNWQLSIFEELKTIKKYQSYLDDQELIRWATLNGAKALGFTDLGFLKKGITPGLNYIDVEVVGGKFDLSKAKASIKLV